VRLGWLFEGAPGLYQLPCVIDVAPDLAASCETPRPAWAHVQKTLAILR